jgi:hypothetical protein
MNVGDKVKISSQSYFEPGEEGIVMEADDDGWFVKVPHTNKRRDDSCYWFPTTYLTLVPSTPTVFSTPKESISAFDIFKLVNEGMSPKEGLDWICLITGLAGQPQNNGDRSINLKERAGTIVNKFGSNVIKFLIDNGFIDISVKYEFGQRIQCKVIDLEGPFYSWYDAVYIVPISDQVHRIACTDGKVRDIISDFIRPVK